MNAAGRTGRPGRVPGGGGRDSFTRAAAKLGTSQSALSHTIRRLEARLGLRLLTRTTRSVAATEAGERLIETLRPALEEIDGRLAALTALREKPAGSIRITTSEHVAEAILLPALIRLLPDYPDIHVELAIEYGLTDIVAERYDAGVRLGEQVAKDMIAVPIGPEQRMAVVGPRPISPDVPPQNPAAAFQPHLHQSAPSHPRRALCLGVREGHAQAECPGGRPACVQHAPRMIIQAALAGMGLACLPQDAVKDDIESGRLLRVLGDWCPPFPGYHLYYPSRRQHSPAFALLVEALRYRPRNKNR